MKIVVKIGGAQLEQPAARARIARAVVRAAQHGGHQVVVVHGGGQQLRQLTDRLGLGEPLKVRGLRVTDPATAEAALMVLGGQVNRGLVLAIARAGGSAVGLTGADGGLFNARPLDPLLGMVGAVERVDPTILSHLTSSLRVPVVASMAPLAPQFVTTDNVDAFFNINADHVVAPLARAFGADAILFLTDVEAVRDANGERIATLDAASARALIESGVIEGGMIPKVETACAAALACPRASIRIAAADHEDAVRMALRSDVGTNFSATESKGTREHG